MSDSGASPSRSDPPEPRKSIFLNDSDPSVIRGVEPVVLRAGQPYPDFDIPPRPPRIIVPLVLFLATCGTTFLRGAFMFWVETTYDPATEQLVREPFLFENFVTRGLFYSVCVMGVLVAHEMGHFLQTLRYRVEASLPYFIPFPLSPFGTMGAVIVQRGSNADRRAMFDIAISGPLAGLLVAIPLTIWGNLTANVTPLLKSPEIQEIGEPLIMQWIGYLVRGPLPPGTTTWLNPPMFAGWVGFFITALNLLPIGQLDGGHIFYCLLPRQARRLSLWIWRGLVVVVLAGGYWYDSRLLSWVLILLLLSLMGVQHPPTADDRVELGYTRTILGWLTLAFIVIGFTPIPFD